MTDEDIANDWLFSYGTLQSGQVQLDTFGRRLEAHTDTLVGFRLALIRIGDAAFVALSGSAEHRTLQRTGSPADTVEGSVLAVTRRELEQADAYEPDGYGRISVELQSGRQAWVYLHTRD